jgi:hypothetical protein
MLVTEIYLHADTKLANRMREEGIAEVYQQYATISLHQRIFSLAYVAWLVTEGFSNLLWPFSNSQPVQYIIGGTDFVLYFVTAGMVLIVLHTYTRLPVPRLCFQIIILLHQLSVAAMSAWKYVHHGPKEFQLLQVFRVVALCCCTLGGARALFLEIGACLEKAQPGVG